MLAAMPTLSKRPLYAICVAFAAASSWVHPAAAEDPDKVDDVIQELFIGDTVYSQDRLELQVTHALRYEQGPGERTFEDALDLQFGLTDRLQVQVEVPGKGVLSSAGLATGLGNLEVGATYNFYSDRRRELALTAVLELGLPTALDGVEPSAYSIRPIFIAYKGVGPLYVNVSVSPEMIFPTESVEPEVGVHAVVGLMFPLGPIVPTLEIGTDFEDLGAGTKTVVAVAPGLTWLPRKDIQIGAAGLVGFTRSSQETGAFLLAIWEGELGD